MALDLATIKGHIVKLKHDASAIKFDDSVASLGVDNVQDAIESAVASVDDWQAVIDASGPVPQLDLDALNGGAGRDLQINANGTLALKISQSNGSVDVGDPGNETSGINVNGTVYAVGLRVNDTAGNTNPGLLHLHKHSTSVPPILVFSRSNSNTTSHSDVSASQVLSRLIATGWTDSSYKIFGDIRIMADDSGTIDGTSAPGRLQLRVTPDGSLTPSVALDIDNALNILVSGDISPSGSGQNLGSNSNRWQTLFVENNGGTIIDVPSAIGTGAQSTAILDFGGGASSASEGGVVTIQFDDIGLGIGARNQLIIDLGVTDINASAGNGNEVQIRTDTGVGSVVGFSIGTAGLLASPSGTLFNQFFVSGAIGSPGMIFRNSIGRITFQGLTGITFDPGTINTGTSVVQTCFFGISIGNANNVRAGFVFLPYKNNINITGAGAPGEQQIALSRFTFQTANTPTYNEIQLTINRPVAANVWIDRPKFNLNGNTVDDTASLYIRDVDTVGTNNWAIFVDDGPSRFDGRMRLEADLATQSVTPAQITSNQNDYSGASGYTVARISTDASRNITGIAAPSNGAETHLYLVNVGSNNFVLTDQDANSSAANRIITGTGASATIQPDENAHLWYDATTQRWRILEVR